MIFQVLSEQTADPQQVRREVALQYPEKNRSMEFLPRKFSSCVNRRKKMGLYDAAFYS